MTTIEILSVMVYLTAAFLYGLIRAERVVAEAHDQIVKEHVRGASLPMAYFYVAHEWKRRAQGHEVTLTLFRAVGWYVILIVVAERLAR